MWQNSSNDLDFVLMAPDETIIDSAYAAEEGYILFSSFPTVEFYRVYYPVSGLWTAKVIAKSVADTEEYAVTLSGFTNIELDFEFDDPARFVQDTIIVTATFTEDGKPVSGATIEAEIDAPTEKVDKRLRRLYEHKRKTGFVEEDFGLDVEDQAEDNVDKDYRTDYLTLYDDGNHGDKGANDGVYANFYTKTATIGSYSFSISASGTSASAGPFTRESYRCIVITEPPEIDFSTGTIDFGNVIVDTSAIAKLIIYNDGNGAAAYINISNIQSTTPAFRPATSKLFLIRPGGEDTLSITFSPTSVGSFKGWLKMRSNDPDEGKLLLTLKGKGIPPP